jgi:phosphoheptose isomerase
MNRSSQIEASIASCGRAIAGLHAQAALVEKTGQALLDCFTRGGKVMTAGNGGSAAEALHLAEELIGRFKADRPALPALALVADSTALTCIGNDFGFDQIFRRQVEGLGRPGDILVLFSTSGKSRNLKEALDAARAKKMVVIALLGGDGGLLKGRADFEICVAADAAARVQEAHQLIVHLWLEMIEGEACAK